MVSVSVSEQFGGCAEACEGIVDRPIELLVFSAQNLVFGAYAGQVAGVTHSSERYVLSDDGFFSFLHKGEEHRGIDFMFWLHCHSGQNDYAGKHTHTLPSMLLLIRSLDCVYRAVWVDDVEKFLTASLDCLHTFPLFMQKRCHAVALWGIVRQKDRLIPLIDLSKLSVT